MIGNGEMQAAPLWTGVETVLAEPVSEAVPRSIACIWMLVPSVKNTIIWPPTGPSAAWASVPRPVILVGAPKALPTLARVVYVIMLFIISVVMINLLIAILTERVSELNRHKDAMQTVQTLSMALLQHRASTKSLVRFVSPFMYITNRARRKYFIESDDRSKIFLHVIEQVAVAPAQQESVDAVTNNAKS